MRRIMCGLVCLVIFGALGCAADEGKSRVKIPSNFTIDIPKSV